VLRLPAPNIFSALYAAVIARAPMSPTLPRGDTRAVAR
jgi:hypothetical protein